jgi:Lon protease-like protein
MGTGGYDPPLAPFKGTVNVSSRFRHALPERTRQQRKPLTIFFRSSRGTNMRDFRDAKAMAQTLREALSAKSVSLTHSESLELVAKLLGFRDWNVLSARISAENRWERLPSDAHLETAIFLPDGRTAVPADASLPVVPVRDIVLFPQTIVPLYVGRASTKQAIQSAITAEKRVFVVTQRHPADDNPTRDGLYGIGVTATAIDVAPLADGTVRVIVKCCERAVIAHLTEGRFFTAEIKPMEESRRLDAEALALSGKVLERFQAYLNINLSSPPYRRLPHITEPGVLADAIAPFLSVEIKDRQDLLETADVVTRLEKLLAIMSTDRRAA